MDINQILKTYWGYNSFRPLQEDIINSILQGKDTLALMPTGGGKSITFQVPTLYMDGMCLVITPLIALMKDQVEELNGRDISAAAIYLGMGSRDIYSNINKAKAGKLKFLYISPERLSSMRFRDRIKQLKICLIAVDESHCISQWGYDFRPSYMKIVEIREYFPKVPILAVTATATKEVAKDIQDKLGFPEHNMFSKSFKRNNISYVARNVNDRLGQLEKILNAVKGSGIIYVRTRKATVELAAFLKSKGFSADFYHAGLSSYKRSKKQDMWKNDYTKIIVSTNAFGMGIDKPNVRIVIHYDMPDSPEAYFQEAGRAGRDGLRSYAVLLYNDAMIKAMQTRATKEFPSKDYVRNVYWFLGGSFGLEEGEAKGMAFQFNPDQFVMKYKLEYVQAMSAIKIIQSSGYLEMSSSINSRSRIIFSEIRDNLNKYSFSKLQDQIIEYSLRNFAGIFVKYSYVNEEDFSDKFGVSRDDIYHALLDLSKMGIIKYIPGNDKPYIVFNEPFMPKSYITIPPEAYEKRRDSLKIKINKMVEYTNLEHTCRQVFLSEYFGQTEDSNCGVCDICLKNKKNRSTLTSSEIEKQIKYLLKDNKISIKKLSSLIKANEDSVLKVVRNMLDDDKLEYENGFILKLKV